MTFKGLPTLEGMVVKSKGNYVVRLVTGEVIRCTSEQMEFEDDVLTLKDVSINGVEYWTIMIAQSSILYFGKAKGISYCSGGE